MDKPAEYHDPDYPMPSTSTSYEQPVHSMEEKLNKIRAIIEKEFTNEINYKQEELNIIDRRSWWARMSLHRLRTTAVSRYYTSALSPSQKQEHIALQTEQRAKAHASSILHNEQKRIHPSLKKLIGKETVDLDEIFKFRSPRITTKKNYMAMLQAKNSTVPADDVTSLRPIKMEVTEDNPTEIQSPTEVLIRPKPKVFKLNNKVVTLNEDTRNKQKYRYRIIIGNTSKYAPPSSAADRSSHKWLLYVRGAPPSSDLSAILSAVHVTLHDSYKPHHTLLLHKPPFHVSRRGWGEFPAKLELHFAMPAMNRPIAVEHTIKLDRNYTGFQTLGSETIVDVWLYSNESMLTCRYDDDTESNIDPLESKIEIKQEMPDIVPEVPTWLDFFAQSKEMNVDDMINKPIKKEFIEYDEMNDDTDNMYENDDKKRLIKYMEPNSGKIYYIEMNRTLDVNNVKEIIIKQNSNSTSPTKDLTKNKGVNGYPKIQLNKQLNILKPKIKIEQEIVETFNDFSHIENDHCYITAPKMELPAESDIVSPIKKSCEYLYEKICNDISRFSCIKIAVNYLLSNIPLIRNLNEVNLKHFPFVVNDEQTYWSYDFTKRRNIEWSRAKLINTILNEHFKYGLTIWRTKQILLYARLHGHYPILTDNTKTDKSEVDNRHTISNQCRHKTLSLFKDSDYEDEGFLELDLTGDDDVDVLSIDIPKIKTESPQKSLILTPLLVDSPEDRLNFLFLEKCCAVIGITLNNQDIGHGYTYSAVHAVLLFSFKKFAEEMIRTALAHKLTREKRKIQEINGLPNLPVWDSWESHSLCSEDIVLSGTRLSFITNSQLGKQKQTHLQPL